MWCLCIKFVLHRLSNRTFPWGPCNLFDSITTVKQMYKYSNPKNKRIRVETMIWQISALVKALDLPPSFLLVFASLCPGQPGKAPENLQTCLKVRLFWKLNTLKKHLILLFKPISWALLVAVNWQWWNQTQTSKCSSLEWLQWNNYVMTNGVLLQI